MHGELLHACLVAEYAALGALRRRVDGQHGQTAPFLAQQVNAKLVDAGRLAGAGHAADAHAHALAAVGQTARYHLLRLLLVGGVDTLYEGDGLREHGDVALQDAFYHLAGAELTTAVAVALQIGVDDRRLLHAAIHLQTSILGAILWMIHAILINFPAPYYIYTSVKTVDSGVNCLQIYG